MFINAPFQSAAELAKLGASKKIVDYIRKHHGYDTSHKMIISKVLGREAYRLYAAVGNQWMDASLQDLDRELFLEAEASTSAAALGKIKSEKKTLAARKNGAKGGWKKGVPRKKKSDSGDAT